MGEGGGGLGEPGFQQAIAADVLLPVLLNSLRGIVNRSVTAARTAPGLRARGRVEEELQEDDAPPGVGTGLPGRQPRGQQAQGALEGATTYLQALGAQRASGGR